MTQIAKINGITLVNTEITSFNYDNVNQFTITDNSTGSFSASMDNISVDSATITEFTASNLLAPTGNITLLTTSIGVINSLTGEEVITTTGSFTSLIGTQGNVTTLTASNLLTTDILSTTGNITTFTSSNALVTDLNSTTGVITDFTSSAINLDGRLTFDDPLKYIEGDVAATMVFNGGGNSMVFRHTSTGFMRGVNGSTGFENSTFPSINSSAIVTMTSTTKGFLPPRVTTTQKNAIASPAAGLIVYDTTTNKHCGYDGTTWNDMY